MAKVRALQTIETSWQLPEDQWQYPQGQPAVRARSLVLKQGEETEAIPDATVEKLLARGLVELA